jgi:hypothetical protein
MRKYLLKRIESLRALDVEAPAKAVTVRRAARVFPD